MVLFVVLAAAPEEDSCGHTTSTMRPSPSSPPRTAINTNRLILPLDATLDSHHHHFVC